MTKLLAIFLLPLTLFACEPFFTVVNPPAGWHFSDPSQYEKGVKVGFVASKRQVFTPAFTFAVEKIGGASQATYIQALRKIYHADRFQELGSFETAAGTAHLFQIDRKTHWGELSLLQAVVIKDGYALIQTGTCLKKDFLSFHETYLKAFKTLRVSPSLYASCSDQALIEKVETMRRCWKKLQATSKDNRETLFESSFFQSHQWKPFVNYIENHLSSEGKCWQFLALKHIQETLLYGE